MDTLLADIWDWEDEELRQKADSFEKTRDEDIVKILKDQLNLLHSDMRWKTAMYYTRFEERPQIHDFRGAIFYWNNYRRSDLNILIYGAPMHEYFWGEYNAEFYHEFCAFKETLRYDYLGLAWTDILGGAQISRDFYGWRDDVYAPGSF